MKNKLIYILLIVAAIISCKKDSGPILDNPDTRLNTEMDAQKELLVAQKDGFFATIFPKGGKGFSFYITFSEDGTVDMLGDFSDQTFTQLQKSTYRFKALQKPTLIFDTYNYLHLIADPNKDVNGGKSGAGLISDFEFVYTGNVGDTLKFDGIFNGNKMSMLPLSAEDSKALIDGGFKKMYDDNAAYMKANRFSEIQLPDGTKETLIIDTAGKVISFFSLDKSQSLHTENASFAYGLNKLILSKGISFGDRTFNELIYDAANNKYYIEIAGSRIDVQNPLKPDAPLYALMGFPLGEYLFTGITIQGNLPQYGINSPFNAVYNSMVSLFKATKRNVLYTTFGFGSNNFYVQITYSNSSGSSYNAIGTYKVVRNNDEFTISDPIGNSNWGPRADEIKPLADYLLTGPFKIDWVESSDPNSPLLGGFYRTADASSFIYGVL
ncbi:DUF4302 domain-containing protein [Pedobacter sp. MW01-1-1]|uniref:DUF4302 domain-containing protein n=1 Tax=Pedobacter sp. MW01-1-1 TaxID=3383027 RepID=UPI003FEFD56B